MEKGFETATVKFKMTPRSGAEQVLHSGMKKNVTVPEVMVMMTVHRDQVQILEVTGPAMERIGVKDDGTPDLVLRTQEQEVSRLRRIYGNNPFRETFPEKRPRLPRTFKEARIHTTIPDNVRAIGTGGKAAGKGKMVAAIAEYDLENDDDNEDFGPDLERQKQEEEKNKGGAA